MVAAPDEFLGARRDHDLRLSSGSGWRLTKPRFSSRSINVVTAAGVRFVSLATTFAGRGP